MTTTLQTSSNSFCCFACQAKEKTLWRVKARKEYPQLQPSLQTAEEVKLAPRLLCEGCLEAARKNQKQLQIAMRIPYFGGGFFQVSGNSERVYVSFSQKASVYNLQRWERLQQRRSR